MDLETPSVDKGVVQILSCLREYKDHVNWFTCLRSLGSVYLLLNSSSGAGYLRYGYVSYHMRLLNVSNVPKCRVEAQQDTRHLGGCA
jgi:hypothetical protein